MELACGRRCVLLYASPARFTCHLCSGLARGYKAGLPYITQNESAADRMTTKAIKIRERLGQAKNGGIGDFPPPKPKGMHWRPYWRLSEADREVERLSWGLAAWCEKRMVRRGAIPEGFGEA